MPAFDIYCNTSHSEAFANTIAEAMLCEIPCVVTDVGDSSLIVQDHGGVIANGDVKAFANKVIQLCKLNENEREALGRSSRKSIVTRYAIERIRREYYQLYERSNGVDYTKS